MTTHLGLQRILLPSAQVSSLTTGSITLPSARGAYSEPGDFESIATSTVGSGGVASVTFNSIPLTFKHLQIRIIGFSSNGNYHYIDSNLTGGRRHLFYHTNSAILSTAEADVSLGFPFSIGGFGGLFANIIDIADYANTNKLKQYKAHLGADINGSGHETFSIGYWTEAGTALNSLTFTMGAGGLFQEHTDIALYGIRG